MGQKQKWRYINVDYKRIIPSRTYSSFVRTIDSCATITEQSVRHGEHIERRELSEESMHHYALYDTPNVEMGSLSRVAPYKSGGRIRVTACRPS